MKFLIEKHDNNFLMHIKTKFKLLVPKDTTVSFLNEIHLKPYFDYIISLSDNSNKAETSAFAFMLNSVFSQYKDGIHIISTHCFKAENLFDRVKFIIIGLNEIGFRVLSITTVNNTINKKQYLFF